MRKHSWYRLYIRTRYPILRGLFKIHSDLTDREKVTLFRLSREVSKKVTPHCSLVEIGSYVGASSFCLAAGLSNRRCYGKVYCIDTWNNEAMTEGIRDTMTEFLNNTSRFSKYIEPIRGRSTDPQIVRRVAELPGKIDLLFIDGDHSFDAVLSDWRTYKPLLSNGALIVMHDIGWAEGVQRVVAEEIRLLAEYSARLNNLWWGRMKQ
jgi:predicted O-methyltransferase YrrM